MRKLEENDWKFLALLFGTMVLMVFLSNCLPTR